MVLLWAGRGDSSQQWGRSIPGMPVEGEIALILAPRGIATDMVFSHGYDRESTTTVLMVSGWLDALLALSHISLICCWGSSIGAKASHWAPRERWLFMVVQGLGVMACGHSVRCGLCFWQMPASLMNICMPCITKQVGHAPV